MSEFLADTLLVIHCAFIAFVVGGFVLTVSGFFCQWGWVHNLWFRLLHLSAILLVVLQQWFGLRCPLTVWESDLREAASGVGYAEPFIVYWLKRLIHYDFPPWAFTLAYTGFGALVVLAWFLVPPRRQRNNRPG